ncbi:cupin domain-containing protein [Paenibacillus eucommiae]|uniref:Quercetin dioxygenase-like cupin family protein n=1 Tax=Paenibacillus eucommiae TaxID=1355755 RepID=A0ABS4J2G0_9BACL|nr:cupin domain-containing protein [Paenibacillus eucommiae]MBP1994028.1 quercetin dioxygenase-like cupin family protein [Paenibacillus eucommiae]
MKLGDWQQINELIRRKVFPPGEQIMSMLVDFKKGGTGPEHSHPHEQLGFVASGKIKITIAGVEHVLVAGEQIHVPSDQPHFVVALEDSLVLETFTPLREDLLNS